MLSQSKRLHWPRAGLTKISVETFFLAVRRRKHDWHRLPQQKAGQIGASGTEQRIGLRVVTIIDSALIKIIDGLSSMLHAA